MMYLQNVKQQNMANILRTILRHQPISRVELVELTGLTSGTITNLTQELIRSHIIKEYAAVSNVVGRKRITLGFDQQYYRLLGLDIGRSSFELVMTDITGEVLRSVEEETETSAGPHDMIEKMTPVIHAFVEEASREKSTVLGLGIGLPGPMDIENGVLVDPPNFPGWSHFPVRDFFEERFQLKTFIEDDARTSALAESWYGLGKKGKDLIFVTMGMGIGCGVISNGELIRGANGLYGQVGHMTIVSDGVLCACGNRGCWETVGSIPGILKRWTNDPSKTIDDLFTMAASGDRWAEQCVEETLVYLETAMINIFNMFDPELIVLGGRLFPYLSPYLEDIRSRFKQRMYTFAQDRITIAPSSFGTSQSAVGAASLVFDQLLRRPLPLLNG